MALPKTKSEGGQGGRLGHSNMVHWESTEEIKVAARKKRRKEAKAQIAEAMRAFVTARNSK